jgi:hypothetical protein
LSFLAIFGKIAVSQLIQIMVPLESALNSLQNTTQKIKNRGESGNLSLQGTVRKFQINLVASIATRRSLNEELSHRH